MAQSALFRFGSKVWRTLRLLFCYPGQLTQQYLAGPREAYVAPGWLYALSCLLLFWRLASVGGQGQTKPISQEIATDWRLAQVGVPPVPAQPAQPKIDLVIRPDTALLHQAARQLRRRAQQGDTAAAAKLARLAVAEQLLTGRLPARKHKHYPNSGPKLRAFDFDISKVNFARLPANLSVAQVDSVISSTGERPTATARLALRRMIRWHTITPTELVFQGSRAAAVMLFLLLPLAALLLQGAYFRQQRPYRSHLVFAVHLHCLAFLLLLLGSLLIEAPRLSGLLALLLVLAAIYVVAALERFYGQSLIRTIIKTLVLALVYVLALGLSMTGLAMAGALIF